MIPQSQLQGLFGPAGGPVPMPSPNAMPLGPAIPVEDYEATRVRQEPDFKPFTDFMREACEQYITPVATEFKVYNARNLRNQKYLYGEQFWDVDPETGTIYQLTPERQWAHIDNQFEYFVEAMVAGLMKSNPKLVAKARSDDRHVQSDLRLIQHWLDTDRPFTDEETMIESYLLILRSRVWYYSYPSLAGPDVERPIYSPREIFTAGAPVFYCHTCGESGVFDGSQSSPDGMAAGAAGEPAGEPATGDRTCPHCQSPAINVIEPKATEVPAQSGTQATPSVVINTAIVDDLQMGWYNPSGTPELSPVLWRDRMMLNDEWAELYPWFDVTMASGTIGEQTETTGIQYFDDLQRTPGNWHADPFATSGRWQSAGGDDRLRRRCREVWLKPYVYRRWKHRIQEGLKLASGIVIPAGVELGQIYPRGICVVWCGDRIIDVRHERAADHWKDLVHKPNPAGGFGRGVETLVALQDKLNAVNIFQMVQLACEANGNVIVNPRVVTDASMRKNINRPGHVIVAGNASTQTDLTKTAAYRLPGAPPRQESFQIPKDTIGSMSSHSNVYAMNEGMDKAPINTATGVNEMASQIAQMTEPRLKARARCRSQIAEQRWKLARMYQTDEQYYSAGDKPGKWITPADLAETDVYFEFDPESHVVRSNDQKRADVAAACQLLGAIPPESELGRIIMAVFGLNDLTGNDRRLWEAKAFARMDRMQEECDAIAPELDMQIAVLRMDPAPDVMVDPMSGQVIDPADVLLTQYATQIVQSVAQPDYRDQDEVFIEVYTRAYASPDSEAWHPLLDRCNLLAIQGHVASGRAKLADAAMAEGEAAAAGEEPGAEKAAARDSKRAEEDHERSERQADAQAGREMAAAGPKKGPK